MESQKSSKSYKNVRKILQGYTSINLTAKTVQIKTDVYCN